MTEFILTLWWIPIAIAIIWVARNIWLIFKIADYIEAIEWVTLEVRIPKDNLKTIKAMEQVFASLHGTYSYGIKRWDRYFKGKVEDWMSLEIAGFSHGVHFYIRCPTKYRKLVETAFFSQYPDAEIEEAEDYTGLLPANLPNNDFDIFGTDFVLARDNAYPIKTYPAFEHPVVEEQSLDPIATIAEVMSNLKNNELIWLQLLVRPTGNEWTKTAKALIDRLTGKGKGGGFFDSIIEFVRNLLMAPLELPVWGGGDKPVAPAERLTPGKQDIIKAIEAKLGKLHFEALLRFIYIDKKDEFTDENITAVMGSIRQFAALEMNSFRPNLKTMTIPRAVGKLFRKERLSRRKQLLYWHYLNRDMPQLSPFRFPLKFQASIFCTEELATVYHPPLSVVTPTKLKVLESRKGGAPVNLPVIEE